MNISTSFAACLRPSRRRAEGASTVPSETDVKGVIGFAALGAIIAGCFAAPHDLQLLCGLLGAVFGVAVVQS